MSTPRMDKSDWDERWRDGRIGFHQPTTTGALEKYADVAWGSDGPSRVFVPLCGKSLDMVYLADRADAVLGVEYVEQAVREFFEERSLTPTVDDESLTTYRADAYTLFAGDFFDVSNAHLDGVDAVFDRASLVALDTETRQEYAAHMRSILPAGTTVLLVAFDYDQSRMDGPPFSVPPDEVERLFEVGFSVDRLDSRDMLDETFRSRGLTAMRETVFLLVRQ